MCTVCGCADTGAASPGTHRHGPEGHHHHHHHDHGEHGHSHAHGDHDHHHHHDGHEHHHHHGDHDHHHHHDDHGHHHHGADGSLDYGRGAAGVHVDGMSQGDLVRIEKDILGKNNDRAAANRARFADRGILALNLLSSPGSGKTTLLVATLTALAGRLPVAVIEGDQQTSADADRIRETGAPALQINTGKGCHLDAKMVADGIDHLDVPESSVLFIENVGNLVCPSAFDLGEAFRVVVASVTEGEDKPLKYPDMFAGADLVIVNKVDLLPYIPFDVDALIANARKVNPGVAAIKLSATSGEGMDRWLAWIEAARALRAAAE